MRILTKYVAMQIAAAIGVVSLALIGLQLFILFVNQLPDMGKGHYDIWAVVKVVCCQLPYQIYLFFPMASLLGVLSGLGMMASHRELVVMQASGISIAQISRAVLLVSFWIMLGVTLIGETLVPKWTAWASDIKMQAMTGNGALRTAQGIWLRQGNDFLFIRDLLSPYELAGVTQFHFTNQFHLEWMQTLEKAHFDGQYWQAFQVLQTQMTLPVIQTTQALKEQWSIQIDPRILKLLNIDADAMTLAQLQRYMRLQERQHQNIDRVRLVYWQRCMQPLSTMVMMMLAIPFIFGSLRSSVMGVKLLMGACCGFSFYILNHFLGGMSQVFQVSPLLAAVLPTGLFAVLGVVLMRYPAR